MCLQTLDCAANSWLVKMSTFLYLYAMVSELTICESFTLKILDYSYDKEQVLSYTSIREAYQQFF